MSGKWTRGIGLARRKSEPSLHLTLTTTTTTTQPRMHSPPGFSAISRKITEVKQNRFCVAQAPHQVTFNLSRTARILRKMEMTPCTRLVLGDGSPSLDVRTELGPTNWLPVCLLSFVFRVIVLGSAGWTHCETVMVRVRGVSPRVPLTTSRSFPPSAPSHRGQTLVMKPKPVARLYAFGMDVSAFLQVVPHQSSSNAPLQGHEGFKSAIHNASRENSQSGRTLLLLSLRHVANASSHLVDVKCAHMRHPATRRRINSGLVSINSRRRYAEAEGGAHPVAALPSPSSRADTPYPSSTSSHPPGFGVVVGDRISARACGLLAVRGRRAASRHPLVFHDSTTILLRSRTGMLIRREVCDKGRMRMGRAERGEERHCRKRTKVLEAGGREGVLDPPGCGTWASLRAPPSGTNVLGVFFLQLTMEVVLSGHLEFTVSCSPSRVLKGMGREWANAVPVEGGSIDHDHLLVDVTVVLIFQRRRLRPAALSTPRVEQDYLSTLTTLAAALNANSDHVVQLTPT
ncbi:hypothetical protein R3P38DRAFT_2814607 [Favolaschia claudopus]|uniref:Uncharacterized protein n=1 Tax=Favolaschia claudopus TaxID=2862362 RepID=A0AAV9Z306_9AGAR